MPIGIGDQAPDFTASDVNGVSYKLSNFSGTPVLLVFSGLSWCQPCQGEAPVLEHLWEDLQTQNCDPLPQFLLVSVNETFDSFKNAVKNLKITFPALYKANDEIAALYGVNGVPTSFVIGPDQKVCNILSGYGGSAEAAYEEFKTALEDCGGCQKPPPADPMRIGDLSRWKAIISILFGGTQDGAGLGFTPGGKPIHIDPLGPPMSLSLDKRNILTGLAISELAKSLHNPKAAREIEAAAMLAVKASATRLAGRVAHEGEAVNLRMSMLPARK